MTGCECRDSIDIRGRRRVTEWKMLSRNLALHRHQMDQELDGCLSAYHFFQYREVKAQEGGEVDVPVYSA